MLEDLAMLTGGRVISEDLGIKERGIYLHSIELPEIPAGVYSLVFSNGDGIATESLVKVQ